MILSIIAVMATMDTVVVGCTVVVGPGILHAPEAVVWSPRGGFWVADRGDARFHFFSPVGVRLWSFGSSGPGGFEFTDRTALTDPGGRFIYVADTDGSRILKLTRDGVVVREIRWPGEISAWAWKPRALASLVDGRVFAIDEGSGRIVVTDPFDGLRTLADTEEDASASLLPAGLACTTRSLVLADQAAGMIRILDLHGNELSRVSVGGAPGSVAIRDDGTLAVVDEESRRILLVKDGTHPSLAAVACSLTCPTSLCFAPDGTLLVADRDGDRILRLTLPAVP